MHNASYIKTQERNKNEQRAIIENKLKLLVG